MSKLKSSFVIPVFEIMIGNCTTHAGSVNDIKIHVLTVLEEEGCVIITSSLLLLYGHSIVIDTGLIFSRNLNYIDMRIYSRNATGCNSSNKADRSLHLNTISITL